MKFEKFLEWGSTSNNTVMGGGHRAKFVSEEGLNFF